MENQELSTNSTLNNLMSRTELRLFGIDKVWVHSGNKGWVEKREIPEPTTVEVTYDLEDSKKKWWQFWK